MDAKHWRCSQVLTSTSCYSGLLSPSPALILQAADDGDCNRLDFNYPQFLPRYEISYNPTLLRVDRTRKYSVILLSQLELLGGKGEGILLMLLNLFPQRVAFKFTPKEPGPIR